MERIITIWKKCIFLSLWKQHRMLCKLVLTSCSYFPTWLAKWKRHIFLMEITKDINQSSFSIFNAILRINRQQLEYSQIQDCTNQIIIMLFCSDKIFKNKLYLCFSRLHIIFPWVVKLQNYYIDLKKESAWFSLNAMTIMNLLMPELLYTTHMNQPTGWLFGSLNVYVS